MLQEPSIGVMEAIRTRRSVRSFQPDRIDEATIRRLLEAAVQAPTAIHLEPWVFVIVQDAKLLAEISSRAKALFTAHMPAHFAAVPAASGLARALADPEYDIFHGSGTLIVICARPLSDFVTADCWLAAQNLMLAARALGLGTCVIGLSSGALQLPEMKAQLGIPAHVTPVAPIVVGVPAGETAAPARRPPEILAWRT
jgi:nitroreductase